MEYMIKTGEYETEQIPLDEDSLITRCREIIKDCGKRTKIERLDEDHSGREKFTFYKPSGGRVTFLLHGYDGNELKAIVSQRDKRRGYNWLCNGQASKNSRNLYHHHHDQNSITLDPENHLIQPVEV